MKGLAAQQVVLLVIGIIVLALVLFLVYNQFTKSNTQIASTSCQTAISSVCISCKTCVLSGGGTHWSASETTCPAIGTNSIQLSANVCQRLCAHPTDCDKSQITTIEHCSSIPNPPGVIEVVEPVECRALGS